jgi:hypothetical protein
MARRAPRKGKMGGFLRFTRTAVFPLAKASADTGYYLATKLSDMVNTDITNLFQEYRITNIQFRFRLPNQLNNNADFPTLYYAPYRQTPSSTPSLVSEITQIQGCKTFQFGPANTTVTFATKPYTLAGNLATSGPGHCLQQDKWFSTESVNVVNQSFAIFVVRYNTTSSPTHTLEYDMTYTVECRGTR